MAQSHLTDEKSAKNLCPLVVRFVKVDAAAARGSCEEYWTETYRMSTGHLTDLTVQVTEK